MPTPVINETDLTAPRSKILMDYITHIVELYYDNGELVNASVTPAVDQTDPNYISPQSFHPSKALQKVIDAVYDYQTTKGKPVSVTP
jgi:hypothetical protein